MEQQNSQWPGRETLKAVVDFVSQSSGLQVGALENNLTLTQKADGKSLSFKISDLEEVLPRADADGKSFLQLNFVEGRKILITDTLVGFKPIEMPGLDMSKIPKVVTTPDLLSVFEAIEEALGSEETTDHELETLKKVFYAVLSGGEKAGFDLTIEKKWLERLFTTKNCASA